MTRDASNGTHHPRVVSPGDEVPVMLPRWVAERYMGRRDSRWSGRIEVDMKEGKIIQIGYTERERAPRPDH